MSTRKAPENASGSKGLKPWMKNLIFAAVILVLAAALYFGVRAAHSGKGGGLQAVVDFGDGITEPDDRNIAIRDVKTNSWL